MNFTRRQFAVAGAALAGAGAAGIPAAMPAAAQAPPGPPAAGQVAGIYRYKVGDITVTAFSDGGVSRPLQDGFVRNAGLEEVRRALADAYMPTDQIHITFTTLLLDTGSRRILVDTGFADNGPPSAGRLLDGLAVSGLKPSDIDLVIISHFHGDHISGLRKKDGSATFPNAEVAVPQPEWAYWMDDARMAAAPEGLKGNFALARRVFGPMAKDVRRFDWGGEVASGVTAVEAAGHTPGHTAFAVTSGEGRLLVLSDVTNMPYLFVRHPDWQVMFDMDGEQARRTRHRLLAMAATERMQVAGYHFPFPATGHIAKDGNGYELVPTVWRATL